MSPSKSKASEPTYLKVAKATAINLLDFPFEIEEGIIPIVKHPLFGSDIVIFPEGEPRFGDLRDPEILEKAKQLKKGFIEESDDIYSLLFLITKPFRLLFLALMKNDTPNDVFSELLAEIWMMVECPNNGAVPLDMLVEWFREADKEKLMSEEELDTLNNLPEEFTVYRGMGDKSSRDGISYTLDQEKAQWFADRPPSEHGYVLSGTAKKEDVLAFFNRRNESEVLIEPKNIADLHKMK